MRLHRIRLEHFKGVDASTVEFAPEGVTIVQGENEVGKTTLADALDLLLSRKATSRAEDVRSAEQVGSDESPFVEVELTAGDHRLTYAKRFGTSAKGSTTLSVEGADPTQLRGDEAHDHAAQLLGTVADLDLWQALRLNQGGGFGQASANNHHSLVRALDRAAGGGHIASDTESDLFERVQAEYRAYHTATGRRTTARSDMETQVERAKAELAQIEARLDEAERETEQAARAANDLAAMEPKLAAQREEIATLEARRTQVDALQHRADQLELAVKELDRAAEAVANQQEHRASCVQQIADFAARLDRAKSAAHDARKAQEQARASSAHLAEQERQAAEHRDQAHKARQTADRLLEALRARDDATELERRIAHAQELSQALVAADARRSGKDQVTEDQALTALETAEQQRATARATAQAQAGSLVIQAHTGVSVAQSSEHGPDTAHELTAGDELQQDLMAPVALRIGEIATVQVRPGADASQVRQHVADAERAVASALEAFGAHDISEARRVHRAWQEARADHERASKDLERVLRGDSLPELADRHARLTKQATNVPIPEGVDQAQQQQAVTHAVEQLAAAERALEDTRSRREGQREHEQTLSVQAATAEHEVKNLSEQRDQVERELAQLRSETDDHTLAQRVAEASQAAQDKRLEYRRAAEELAASDASTIITGHENATAVAERIEREQRDLEHKLTALQATLRTKGAEGLAAQRDAAGTALDRATRDYERTETKAAAAKLLYEQMTKYREAAREAYAAPLTERIVELGRIVFGSDFTITLDDNLDIATRTLNDITLPYDQLSGGAREQLDVLARLACAAVVADDDAGVPLMLDDTLVYTDTERLKRLGAAIRAGTGHAQVIILTCVPDRFAHIGDATVVRLP